MEENNSKLSGVFKHKQSAENYSLRRYFPNENLSNLVEQFWFVDWDLGDKCHTQTNLPDPNFHMVIHNGEAKIIGPVTKVYSFEMMGKNQIIGVKFNIGVMADLLNKPMIDYVDIEVSADEIFANSLSAGMFSANEVSDSLWVEKLQVLLSPLVSQSSLQIDRQQQEVAACLKLIKQDAAVNTVEQLAERRGLSVRTLQRYFVKYVGLSPKWLIRKYRLHQAIDDLDSGEADLLDIVERLDYSDQSHLIKDFKQIIGVTPSKYLSE